MAFYEARVEPPVESARFIDALREHASAEIIVTIEAKSKREAAEKLSESCSVWWGDRRYQDDWFEDRLRTLRGKERAIAQGMLR